MKRQVLDSRGISWAARTTRPTLFVLPEGEDWHRAEGALRDITQGQSQLNTWNPVELHTHLPRWFDNVIPDPGKKAQPSASSRVRCVDAFTVFDLWLH